LNRTIAHRNLGVDAGPGSFDLTPVNPTDIVAKPVGADFGGTNGYLRGAYANWRSADSLGSIFAWIKTSTANETIFCSADEGSGLFFLQLAIIGSYLRISQRNNDVQDTVDATTTRVDDNIWHHIGVISTGTAWLLYVDGNSEALNVVSGVNNGDWLADTIARDNVVIGALVRSTIAGYFNGEIKDVRYYSKVLT
jgi:hypothetical protein